MSTREPATDGTKGPRWIGDKLPSLPPALQYAADLPPKVTDKYVFFFGFEGPEPECGLQQWYPSPFTEKDDRMGEERHFKTSEQYMMYHKALLMGDAVVADKILRSDTPAEAKTLGREVKGFKPELWEAECDRIVEEGQFLKFSQDDRLKTVLMGTEEREIVETSPNDKFWGIGFNTEDAEAHVEEWGENKLGKALMRARERLAPLKLL